jgi:transposase InsO family protein
MVLTLRFLVLDALEQALYARQPERDGASIHHSDRGSQYVSIRDSARQSGRNNSMT